MYIAEYRINGTKIYKLAWSLAQITVLIGSSELINTILGNAIIRNSIYIFAIALLLTKVLFIDKYRIGTIVIILGVLVIIFAVSYKALGITLLLHWAFIVSARRIKLKRLIYRDVMIRISVMSILMILSVSGVINNYSAEINGSMKYAFGWLHPNSFALCWVLILVEWLYLSEFRLTKLRFLTIVASILFLGIFCAGRTALYAFVGIFIISIAGAIKPRFQNSKFMKLVYYVSMPASTLISWILVLLYVKGYQIAKIADSFMTSRLSYAKSYLIQYGVSLFGSRIETVSTREHILYKTWARILDMSYIRLPIEYGLIYSVLLFVYYIILQALLVKRKMFNEAIVVVFFSIIGIASTSYLSPFSNFSMLFLWIVLDQKSVMTMKGNIV